MRSVFVWRHGRAVAAARLLCLCCLLAALVTVLATTLQAPLKDDIAWLLYVAGQWLDGRRLYVDLVEVNPPLIIWMCAVPVRLAQLLAVPAKQVALLMVAAVLLGCAWWSATLLRSQGRAFADRLIGFSLIGSVLLLIPGGEFGQREHLLIALALPYLAMVSGEVCGTRPRAWHGILVGMVGGIGCALKPQYLLAFGGVELFALAQGVRLFRPVSLAAAATLVAYVAAVGLFTPDYFRDAVPMALSIYGAGTVPLWDLLFECRYLFFAIAAGAVLLATARDAPDDRRRLALLLIFSACATLACILQGKNWFYHRIPATISTVLAMIGLIRLRCMAGGPAPDAARQAVRDGVARWWRDWRTVVPAVAVMLALFSFGISAFDRLDPQVRLALSRKETMEARLAAVIQRTHAHTYIAFSEWIGLGFPVVNNTGVAWASRFDSMWALHDMLNAPAGGAHPIGHPIARAEGHTLAGPTPGSAAGPDGEWPIADWVVADFLHTCPDLAVVDRRSTADYIALLSRARPEFKRAWQLYRPIAGFNGIIVFHNQGTEAQRRAKGCGYPKNTPIASR